MTSAPDATVATPLRRRLRRAVAIGSGTAVLSLLLLGVAGIASGVTTASDSARTSSITRSNDVFWNQLGVGACLTASYQNRGDDSALITFSNEAVLFRVVECSTPHRAQLISRVTPPVSSVDDVDWPLWGSNMGPTVGEAADRATARCESDQARLQAVRADHAVAQAKDLTAAVIRQSVPILGSPVLGLCVLDFGKDVSGDWRSELSGHAKAGKALLATMTGVASTSAVRAGTCLSNSIGPDADWHSPVSCTAWHRYSVFSRLRLDDDDLNAGTTWSVLHDGSSGDAASSSGNGSDAGADSSSTPASQSSVQQKLSPFLATNIVTCEGIAAADVGLDEDAGIPDSLAMYPSGAFSYDVSLATSADFAKGNTDVLCSLEWMDTDGDPVWVTSNQSTFTMANYYSASTPLVDLRCYRSDVTASEVIPCSSKHAFQLMSTFDARSLVDADDIAAVMAGGHGSTAMQHTLATVCAKALAVAVPHNDAVYAFEFPEDASWSNSGDDPLPVDCYVAADDKGTRTTGSLFRG